jgi:hypothetical protein
MSQPFDPAERWQHLLSQHTELDDIPIEIARVRLIKCAAIALAVTRGQQLHLDGLRHVALYLQEAALDPLRELGVYAGGQTTEDAWRVVDELPWPTLGGPRPHPD